MNKILYPYREITSAKNEFIIETAKLKDKKYRDRTGSFLIEGRKLASELFRFAAADVTHVILTEDNIGFLNRSDEFEKYSRKTDIILTNHAVISKLTDEKSPQGIVCVTKKFDKTRSLRYNLPVIILDGVQNPGNLGGIMRTMNALGGFDLILSGNCADIYSEKTIRASMGALFYQNTVFRNDIQSAIAELRKEGYKIYATHLSKDSVGINEIVFDRKTAIIFGSEGGGLDSSVPALCDGNVLIPISGNAESLNLAAAAAIFLWKMKGDTAPRPF